MKRTANWKVTGHRTRVALAAIAGAVIGGGVGWWQFDRQFESLIDFFVRQGGNWQLYAGGLAEFVVWIGAYAAAMLGMCGGAVLAAGLHVAGRMRNAGQRGEAVSVRRKEMLEAARELQEEKRKVKAATPEKPRGEKWLRDWREGEDSDA